MDSQMNEILNNFTKELNILLEAKTVDEALYGLIAYLHNGLRILNEVILHLEQK